MNELIGYEVDRDGVATLSWDMPGSVNVLNESSMAAFSARLETALADPEVRGIVVASAKKDFIAGADLALLRDAASMDPGALLAMNLRFKAVLRRMETSGKRLVAALDGTALGGGFELALACHHRVAADRPAARIGLPEVKIGLIPGGGGTQRLARLLGARDALALMTEGKTLPPRAAEKKGLVHEVVEAERLLEVARSAALRAGARQPWDEPGFRIPGGEIQSPRGYETFIGGNALLRKKTWGNHPAPRAIMACVYHGLQMDIDQGSKYEARRFVEIARGPVAANMVRTLFFAIGAANRLERRPAGIPTARFRRTGVLGAGMMGAGIAYQAAIAGLEVVLLDATLEQAEAGKAKVRALLEEQKRRRRLDAAEVERLLGRIETTTEFPRLAGADIVIEAVYEDRAVKAEVTKRAAAHLGEDAIFASNTSTLPIGSLAEAFPAPERFVGLHFFSPVEKMPLVEVIRGAKTSDRTVASSLDLVRLLGKTPIVVHDRRGFFTSRVFGTYVAEGLSLLLEGVPPALIENAGRRAGMPVGPLALADEVSLELVARVEAATEADLGPAYVAPPSAPVVRALMERGRVGKKVGAGFYDYPAGEHKRLWPGLADLFPAAPEAFSAEALGERLLLVQAIEAVRCLEEGVLDHPADADVGSILGWGFPPFTGGVLSYLDGLGLPEALARAEVLAARHGARFSPPEGMRTRAAAGAKFHDRR